jgi:hypothetical protein
MHPLELQVIGPRGGITQQKFGIHPLATLMPSYTEAERESLRASIERDGVEVPIVIYQGKILDGRNRGYFASIFNKPVHITEFTGTEEQARRLVIKLNADLPYNRSEAQRCQESGNQLTGSRQNQFQPVDTIGSSKLTRRGSCQLRCKKRRSL